MAQPYADIIGGIVSNIKKAVVGKDEPIRLMLAALIAGGHALIEDVPGLGKTTLVSALAKSVGCSFGRIQFTPDVLPSDVTGFTLYDIKTGEKRVQFGGVMRQIVLADEINRTSPKTQSSLLEAMQEGQVTIDGESYPLPQPFMVLATQNPVEMTGTYPLPEAQLDRFLLRIRMGYPGRGEETEILRMRKSDNPLDTLESVAGESDIALLREAHGGITCAESVMDYIVSISEATRKDDRVTLGASPRASMALMHASMAWAMISGRDFVLPDDVQHMAAPVLAHRLLLHAQAGFQNKSADDIVGGILRQVRVPLAT